MAYFLEAEQRGPEAEKFYRKAIITAGQGHLHISNLQLDLAKYLEARGKDKQALEYWVYWACSDNSTFDDLSYVANKVNEWLRRGLVKLKEEERKILLKDLVNNMEKKSDEASAQDFSRLAWLYANIKDPDKGLRAAVRGLKLDYNNQDCRKVYSSLTRK